MKFPRRWFCRPAPKCPPTIGDRPLGRLGKPRVLQAQLRVRLAPGVDFDDEDAVRAYLARDPAWQKANEQFGPLRIMRAVPLPKGALAELVNSARKNADRYGFRDYDPQFNQYFHVLAPRAKRDLAALYCALGAARVIASVEIVEPTVATSSLGYRLEAAQRGIGAASVLPSVSSGANPPIGQVRLAALELDWLGALGLPEIDWHPDRTVTGNVDDIRHGTQTFGVIAGRDATWGVDGVAVGVQFLRCPTVLAVPPVAGGPLFDAQMEMLAAAILGAALRLAPGDVLLIERAMAGQQPVELDPLVYDAIRTAVAGRNLVVVEPAGNAGQWLQDFVGHRVTTNGPVERRMRCAEAGTHSGAIVVAAGDSGEVDPAMFGQASPNTNAGEMIDCWAWGDSIRSFDVGASGGNLYLVNDTTGYGETSGASAIAAGAVALVQAMRHTAGLPPLDAMQMRTLLRENGPRGQGDLDGVRMPDAVDMAKRALDPAPIAPTPTPCAPAPG